MRGSPRYVTVRLTLRGARAVENALRVQLRKEWSYTLSGAAESISDVVYEADVEFCAEQARLWHRARGDTT